MAKKEKDFKLNAADPDDVKPQLDEAWFDEADAFVGSKLIRRGRPRIQNPKQPISLRLDYDVVEWFKQSGDGWQTRINSELRKVAGL